MTAPVRLHDININHVEIRSLRHGPEVQREVGVFAARTYLFAHAFAPARTGHYKASLYVRYRPSRDPNWEVGATDFKAWWVEFGAFNRPGPMRPQAVLRRAMIMAGLKVLPMTGKR